MPNDSAERTNLSSQSGDHFSSSGDGGLEGQTESLPYRKRRRIAKLYLAAKPLPLGSVAGQAVILIRKPILYYPLFLLSSSLFGKELQISRILVGKSPTSRKNEKNEGPKMGQSWAISDER